jgi:lipopolysaccharide/colanic/teichoic acid biosynthesis glycosyltransferase
MAVVGLVVRLGLGSPVLFSQERPGRGEKLFRLVKFRTMTSATGQNGELLDDNQRLTRLGRILRSTSLDELPELLNVVRGDMSLVGPRPLLARYLPRYSLKHRRRHDVRPGLTGLAQVAGRNALSWEAKLDLDVKYVDNASLRLDIAILLRTIAAVFARRGISAPGHATMPEFTGELRDGDRREP